MNLPAKMKDAMSQVKQLEGQTSDKVKNGSNQENHINMVYYSGIYNGMKFFVHILDNYKIMTDSRFDEIFRSMLHPQKQGEEKNDSMD